MFFKEDRAAVLCHIENTLKVDIDYCVPVLLAHGEDKTVDGIVVNEKCQSLSKKIKEIIDAKSSFTDWLNNQRVRDQLKQDIKICLVKNGYPPQYTPEVFREVMDQVENFKENE